MAELYRDPTQPVDRRVEDLFVRMTIEEKMAQLCAVIVPFGKPPVERTASGVIPSESLRVALAHGLGGIAYLHMGSRVRESVEYSAAVQKYACEHTRLGIPLFLFEEALGGFVAYESTQFPAPPGLAATFDPDLVEECFRAIGAEARARGANMVLAPVADLGRDPRWGRVQETFGEDTFLASHMVAAAVRGFQGGAGGPRPGHVAATLKHFAGFGQSDGGRQMAPVNMGPNALSNEILPVFRAGIRVGAAAVMPAYHEIDGVPCHANAWLLDTVLRRRWKFDGLVVADFGGIEHLMGMHRLASDLRDAARRALRAGVDMDLPSGTCYPLLADEIGRDPELRARFEQAVRRVLTLKFRLGLFENPFPSDTAAAVVSSDTHQALALRAGEQGIILLKNERGILPLDLGRIRRIACIGPHADLPHLGPDRRGMTTILTGLRKEIGGEAEIVWAQGCRLTTKDGAPPVYLEETAQSALTELQKIDTNARLAELYRSDRPQLIPLEYEQEQIREAVEAARRADVVVVCLGESSWCIGENYAPNRRGDRDSLELIGNQYELLRAVKSTGKPVVVVLVHTRALALGTVEPLADAIVDVWDGGERRGTAVARVLLGKAEPGGRLPVSIPLATGQVPCHYSQKPTGYTRTYAFREKRWAYPFGYGLTYSELTVDACHACPDQLKRGEPAVIRAAVHNHGVRPATAVVQAYLMPPAGSSLTRPERFLAAFARQTLAPGSTAEVTLTIAAGTFAYVNEQGEDTVEPGEYRVGVGLDSERLTVVTVNVL